MIKISKVSKGLPAMIAMAFLIGMTAVAMMWGCGKKGPPEPPTGSRPPRVRDLGYSISNNSIKLSWTIPQPDEEAQLPIAGFLIFRSQQSVVERECPNCPIRFKHIGDVPVRRPGPGQPGKPLITFIETIEPGYRYIYKVNGYSADGIGSKNSNFVEFTF
jgi:hypothetical protein